jgi:hypothetical protein
MGSVAKEITITSRKGDLLTQEAVKELKNAVNCGVVIKGEADEERYRAAIDRFNKAWIAEAVCLYQT